MEQKRIFKLILAALAIMLVVLPFIVSINDLLTRVIENFGWYLFIQRKIVPWEVKMIGVMVRPFGIDFTAYPEGFVANETYAKLSWNCLGWQSLLLFFISLPFGFRAGDYTFISKTVVFILGLLGTFWVNLLRIVLTVLLLVVSRSLFAIVFHDYLAAIMTVLWLGAFWWLSYSFILEEKPIKE